MLPLVIIAVAIATLVVLVAWAKVHPFLAFILVSAGAAVALGMPLADVPGAVRKGIGDILGSLAIVIVCGAMLGKLVVESGAAQRIAYTLVGACGEKRMAWAMMLTGFIVGIPLFYGVGFVQWPPLGRSFSRMSPPQDRRPRIGGPLRRPSLAKRLVANRYVPQVVYGRLLTPSTRRSVHGRRGHRVSQAKPTPTTWRPRGVPPLRATSAREDAAPQGSLGEPRDPLVPAH